MSKAEAIAVSRAVETLLIRENHRFMAEIREALEPGYLLRAAEYLLGMLRACLYRHWISGK